LKTWEKFRQSVPDSRRVVVKIGSRVLVQKTGRPDARRMRELVRQLSVLRRGGCEVVVVTSGAVAAGVEALGMTSRPSALPELQMAAAVGQTRLMCRYDHLFGAQGVQVGQVLLTHADFQHKVRLSNARRTMETMIRRGVVPIVNENDVVADEEIKADLALGDNDLLASLLVRLIRADLLIVLSTVDGLREPGPNGTTRRVRCIESLNADVFKLVRGGASAMSKGGMLSKLKAAQSASKAGCASVIANGREDDVVCRIVRGEDVGTLILASGL
jgi:glutamate 5-kinase